MSRRATRLVKLGAATDAVYCPADGLLFSELAEAGDGVAVVSSDPRGRHVHQLLAKSTTGAQTDTLSGLGVAAIGATIYVARNKLDSTSVLLAVDTATGSSAPIPVVSQWAQILNVTVSPTGDQLALAFLDQANGQLRVGVVPVQGGTVTA